MKYAFIILFFLLSLLVFSEELIEELNRYQTTVTVYGERIPLEEREVILTPAQITIITGEDIQKMGVKNFSEVIEQSVGAAGRDLTGNPVERIVDLRGFPEGDSITVLIDGVKLNNIADNSFNFDIIPLEIIERVEIYSGAMAPLYGGGAMGGVINIVTKKGVKPPRIDLNLKAGSFDEKYYGTTVILSKGNHSFFSTISKRSSEGYRENDGYRIDDAFLKYNFEDEKNNSLMFLYKYNGGKIDAPGALTEEEMNDDRRASPFNKYDNSRKRHEIISILYSKRLKEGNYFSLELFKRGLVREILTTGRYLSGFSTKSEDKLNGITFEYNHRRNLYKGTIDFSFVQEISKGKDISKGFYTNFYGDKLLKATSTKTDNDNIAAYLNLSYITSRNKFDIGFRRDITKYDYRDFINEANSTDRKFLETSIRGAYSLIITASSSLFFAYSQGYKIPTINELFSYPGFYSNPDLKPSKVNDYEIGYKIINDKIMAKLTIFDMFLRDECVFVLTNPAYFIGMNKNIGKSYRRGVEGEIKFYLKDGLNVSMNQTIRETKVTEGPYDGKEIPMVPKIISNIEIEKHFNRFYSRLGLRYVGSQFLDNDLKNQREKLPSYTILGFSCGYKKGNFDFSFNIDNLLNRKYATRGVTNGFTDFYNPAYPITAHFGIRFSF